MGDGEGRGELCKGLDADVFLRLPRQPDHAGVGLGTDFVDVAMFRALAALEEYAVEASIAKVACSEMLDFVIDENVQIHGGNGFVADYPADRRALIPFLL